MKQIIRTGIALGLAAMALIATGCANTQTTASQCAYQIRNGYFDARHIERILHPGERHNSSNVKTHYVYCNARNYIVSTAKDANVDQTSPIAAKTKADSDGDGTPVFFEGSMHWSLNQNTDVMTPFLTFCEKYNCFSPKDTGDNNGNGRSATHGWLNMTQENHRFAFQRAVQEAMLEFGPNVWNDQSQWPKVADAITTRLKDELRKQDSSGDVDYFCGPGVKPEGSSWTCPDITVNVDTIYPQDDGIRQIYNQQVRQQQEQSLAVQQEKTNAAQLKAAKAKYGSLAEAALMAIDACQGKTSCYIGTLPATSGN